MGALIDFDRERYRDLCEEMKSVLQLEKEVAARKDKLRKELIEVAGGERMEYGIKLTQKSSMGAVDYKQIVEDHLNIDDVMKDSYRKPGRSFWEVRSY